MVIDPTVPDPAQVALIERFHGVSLKDASPEALRFLVSQCKTAGNAAFKQQDYKGDDVSGFKSSVRLMHREVI
jgi:hypothetical protein